MAQLPKRRPALRFVHVNLFDLIVDHLKARRFYEKALETQRRNGDAALLNVLAAPLEASKLAQVFADAVKPAEQDLVLVSGVGSAYPLLRTHNLLNNLHHHLGRTPLVMFYPAFTTASRYGCSERCPTSPITAPSGS